MIKSAVSLFFLVFFTLPLTFVVLVAAWVINPMIAIFMLMALGGLLYRVTQYTIENENDYWD